MKVAVIGAGAMGRAISRGAHDSDPDRWSFVFFDPHEQSARDAAKAVAGTVARSANDAVAEAELVILAVKPQVQAQVIRELEPGSACYVSIAAGRSTDDIDGDFAQGGHSSVPLVRVMPNVNAMIGKATTAVCDNGKVSEPQLDSARSLFDSVGTTQEIPEKLFPAFTAMAGCSPAWYFRIANSMALAGVRQGLTKAQAIKAAVSAMEGSAAMLLKTLEDGGHAEALVDQVCSPGGTTIAGMLAAEEAGLSAALDAAVDAAVVRDRELAG
ncbi:pyrroline-5-carboxylate reductase [Actinomycetaceae bacterium MB13-C1-2]|nr:pyrroline-5-carboxylate reductase [Actinomycetaceae bacterium MB13-C1-2]